MKRKWIPPADLDEECRMLCIALNKLKGIRTTESCCGHGERPYHIFFQPRRVKDLLPILYWMQTCHSPVDGRWHVEAYTDCGGDRVFWDLEGPIGEMAYNDSYIIAKQLEEHE